MRRPLPSARVRQARRESVVTDVGSLGRGCEAGRNLLRKSRRPYPAITALCKRALKKVADIDATMSAIAQFAHRFAKRGRIGSAALTTADCREWSRCGVASRESFGLSARASIARHRKLGGLYCPAPADAFPDDRPAVSLRRSWFASLTVRLPSIISSQV
jgi:hypothetical protein